jgi:hypothetical protein
MGIPIIPPDERFVGYLWLKLSAIVKGIPWVEDPPNGIWRLWPNIIGDYIYYDSDWQIVLTWSQPYTSLVVSRASEGYIAYSYNVSRAHCYYGANSITRPDARWRLGNHMIYYYDPTMLPDSLQDQAATAGVGDIAKLYAEPIAGNVNNRTVRFARQSDGTCIYIKQE